MTVDDACKRVGAASDVKHHNFASVIVIDSVSLVAQFSTQGSGSKVRVACHTDAMLAP